MKKTLLPFALAFALLLPGAARAQYDNPEPGGPGAGGCKSGDVIIDTQANLTFSPAEVTIQPGQTVCWRNAGGGMAHNVHSAGNFQCSETCDPDPGNPVDPAGEPSASPWTARLVFNFPGTIQFQCDAHYLQGMSGRVIVQGDAPAGDPGTLAFGASSARAGEGAGSARITVQRKGGSDGAVSVHYASTDGSAKAGQDYAAVSGTLSWAAGQGGSQSFDVPLLEDAAVEPDETVLLSLSNPTGGATLASPSSATLTITDDDAAPVPPPAAGVAGEVGFASPTFEVAEGAGNAVVTLQRNGGSSGAVSVEFAATAGTATTAADFQTVTRTVSWLNGDAAPKEVLIPIVDDSEDEGAETIHLGLSAATGGVSLASPPSANLVILDDDGAAGCSEADGETLCLGAGDRFKVQVSLRTQQGENGRGKAFPLALEDSGLFTFFDPGNAEVLIKVLNTCSFSNHIWVFFAATTNQEYTLTVTDTQKGVSTYFVRDFTLEEPETVFDFQAFSTCP